MFEIPLHPEQIMQEALEFNQKLAKGFVAMSQVGEVEVGTTPKQAVYKEDKMTLYRYTPVKEQLQSIPLLIVYALVNRPYMIDLQEDRSIIKGLLEKGVDVYLVDWGYPDGADRYLGLEDYVNGYIHRCIKHICKEHELPHVNLLGICQGGTFSLCYTALHPEKIKNLITMVTPVDFHTSENMLSAWSQGLDVDLMVDTMGNIPGELLNLTFLSLKPYRLMGQKYADMVDILDDPTKLRNFMRMEQWIFDSPDQAGECFRDFTKNFYQKNSFINGGLSIDDENVDLKNITVPVLNIYATEDHLVPPSASIPLGDLIGSEDYSAIAFKAGHIGIYVSGRAQKEIPPAISEWLQQRDH